VYPDHLSAIVNQSDEDDEDDRADGEAVNKRLDRLINFLATYLP
jgi:hypothetical protein